MSSEKTEAALADSEFEEFEITEVRKHPEGYEVLNGARCFWLSKEYGVVPFEGATVRMWPGGFSPIRGVMINDQLAFYRTPEEEKQYQKEQQFGTSVSELIERWDSGIGIWSIEMGGLGPGYEQAIQVCMIEYLRELEAHKGEFPDNDEGRKNLAELIRSNLYENEVVNALGLSGAQFGAAGNLAWCFYNKGPIGVMEDEEVKERHIQISKHFPRAA